MNATDNCSIQQRYTWTGMYKDIEHYVSVFSDLNIWFNKYNSTIEFNMIIVTYVLIGEDLPYLSNGSGLPPQPQKKLQPTSPPSLSWKHIGMDLICDFLESEEGFKHIY